MAIKIVATLLSGETAFSFTAAKEDTPDTLAQAFADSHLVCIVGTSYDLLVQVLTWTLHHKWVQFDLLHGDKVSG